MYTGPCPDWYVEVEADDDVCILPLITANDNSVIAKEVTFEGEYLPPALELPFADFGLLLEQEEQFRSSAAETDQHAQSISATRPRLLCALRFQCRSQVKRHQLLWHEAEPLGLKCASRSRNRCRLCREQFPSVRQLASHLNAQHPRSAVCDLCLTTFRNVNTLEWHRKHHRDSMDDADNRNPPKYVCDVCRKRCTSSSHLHLHRKVHLEQKPYACAHCDRTFSSSGNRQKHIVRVHTHERKYHCTKCDESFIYPRQLKLHRERTHGSGTEEDAPADGGHPQKAEHYKEQRAFVCVHCAKRFKQATHLRNHLLTHTGVRAYECEFCAKRFAMAGDLRVHRRIHTKEKPFRCDLCPAAFIMGKQLTKHCSTTHGPNEKC